MASPIHADLRSAQEQLASIVSAVTRVQTSLTDIANRSTEETRVAQERLDAVEAQLAVSTSEMEGLWRANEELQGEVDEAKQGGMTKAREAKEKVVRKLRGMMSALDAILVDLEAEDDGIALSTKSKGKQKAKREPRAFLEPRPRVLSSSDSSDTARPTRSNPNGRQTLLQSQAGPSGARRQTSGASEGNRAQPVITRTISKRSRSPGETVKATSTEESSSASMAGNADWKIHYSKPPHSIAVASPGIKWEDLPQRLGPIMNGKTIAMSIKIVRDIEAVFVYDAIKLEGPSGTYLVDWAHNESARLRTEQYVTNGGEPGDQVYHTFLYEKKKLELIFDQSKVKLAAKLSDRTNGYRDRQLIRKAMDEKNLKQMCFQIDGKPFVKASREFMRQIGFSPGEIVITSS
ncbi:hypothetical protein HWV62_32523 [Athelia sp. TMB]|nr:hypothetical protein HWV62_32523 [Athelia sp. TMB]